MKKIVFTYLFLLLVSSFFYACSKEDIGVSKVYLKLDLKDSKYNSLNEIGGVLYLENILIVRLNSQNFAAVTQNCADACITEFNAGDLLFSCPCIGHFYNSTGAALDGSASLRTYHTDLQDNILHVYE